MLRFGPLLAVLLGLLVTDAGFAGVADRTPLPLPPRTIDRADGAKGSTSQDPATARTTGTGWGTTLMGLALVLGLILIVAKVLRKSLPAARATLPSDVVQVLGRRVIDYRNAIHLVRLGSRLLLLGTCAEGLRTLAEITDPVEIDLLVGACQPAATERTGPVFGALVRKLQGEESIDPGTDTAVLRLQDRLSAAAGEYDAPVALPPAREVAG